MNFMDLRGETSLLQRQRRVELLPGEQTEEIICKENVKLYCFLMCFLKLGLPD